MLHLTISNQIKFETGSKLSDDIQPNLTNLNTTIAKLIPNLKHVNLTAKENHRNQKVYEIIHEPTETFQTQSLNLINNQCFNPHHH